MISAVLTQISASEFVKPDVDYMAILPMLFVFVGALLGVVVEAFASRSTRSFIQRAIALLALIGALAAVLLQWSKDEPLTTLSGALSIDAPTLFLQLLIVALSLVALATMMDDPHSDQSAFAAAASATPGSPAEAETRRLGWAQTEIYPLMLFSVGGMMMFPAANDLLTMFVALEVFSLPLYLMAGMARRRRLLSQEASLKYFLLGAFSSALFLYGAALIYGFSGSIKLMDISRAVVFNAGMDTMLLAGIGLVAIGMLFKVGAVPFHQWTPDVYQGSPTPITGFMAACTKVAAFGAMLRLFYVAFPMIRDTWLPALWVIAALTMFVGSVIAVVQTDIKRMLAYSSIAHGGFLLVGLLAMDTHGISSVLFYLVTYGFTTLGAFALVSFVRSGDDGAVGGEATALSAWAGLAKASPVVAGLFSLFLLAMAGIPLTSGFAGKFAVFSAAIGSGGAWGTTVVVIGVLSSAIAAFFYMRVIVLMYFTEPASASTTRVVMPGMGTQVAVAVGAALTIILGVYPGLVLELAGQATAFMP